ncbi:DUF4097 domain-containing protein [Horticoccus luteus]|uniref:DUF4097 domain-containing protein n=1 Tax=Horticoccus luteus TaxID=2862869 RepID=A0A8F9TVE3_9BACT|nr:DUF4097 family beta strand repeat-containing protein [Horticoccus luteus]QYM78484.1 DUF4097 domain-containing protein [Horticoccus luteus]
MKTTVFLFAGLVALVPALQAKIERSVEKTFNVKPGGTLNVKTQGGDISVETGLIDRVEVKAREVIRASSDAEADKILADLDLKIEQSGNDVSAEAKYAKSSGWFSSGPQLVQVSFTIKVPARYNVDLHTSGGDIGVEDLIGTVSAQTSGGSVNVGKITGEVTATTSGGNIGLASATGSTKLRTSGGNIKVDHIGGDADLETSGGDIKVHEVTGVLQASTSGGDVSAALTGPLKGDCSLRTSGGDVRVSVKPGVAFNLDAATSGGKVEAGGLTIELASGGSGRSQLKGKVNGGGKELKLRTSGGDVRVTTSGS